MSHKGSQTARSHTSHTSSTKTLSIAAVVHPKTPNKTSSFKNDYGLSPNQKLAYKKEIEVKFTKPASATLKAQIEKTLLFKELTQAEKQAQKDRNERKNKVTTIYKVKMEGGKITENGKSEYNTISNPRPEPDFKPCQRKIMCGPSKSAYEQIKKPKKDTPSHIKIPIGRDPITEGEVPKPWSPRDTEFKPSIDLHLINARRWMLPTDVEATRGSLSARSPSYSRLMYIQHTSVGTMDDEPVNLIRQRTASGNLGDEMKALIQSKFSALTRSGSVPEEQPLSKSGFASPREKAACKSGFASPKAPLSKSGFASPKKEEKCQA